MCVSALETVGNMPCHLLTPVVAGLRMMRGWSASGSSSWARYYNWGLSTSIFSSQYVRKVTDE